MAQFSREQYRFYIFVEWQNGTDVSRIHEKLIKACGHKAPSIRTVRQWVKNFNDGRDCLVDEPRSGRPCEAVMQENVENIHNMLNKDSHKKIQELASETGISVGSTCTVLHKELELHKVAAKWIPHVLTEENKSKRVEISRQPLSIF